MRNSIAPGILVALAVLGSAPPVAAASRFDELPGARSSRAAHLTAGSGTSVRAIFPDALCGTVQFTLSSPSPGVARYNILLQSYDGLVDINQVYWGISWQAVVLFPTVGTSSGTIGGPGVIDPNSPTYSATGTFSPGRGVVDARISGNFSVLYGFPVGEQSCSLSPTDVLFVPQGLSNQAVTSTI